MGYSMFNVGVLVDQKLMSIFSHYYHTHIGLQIQAPQQGPVFAMDRTVTGGYIKSVPKAVVNARHNYFGAARLSRLRVLRPQVEERHIEGIDLR